MQKFKVLSLNIKKSKSEDIKESVDSIQFLKDGILSSCDTNISLLGKYYTDKYLSSKNNLEYSENMFNQNILVEGMENVFPNIFDRFHPWTSDFQISMRQKY